MQALALRARLVSDKVAMAAGLDVRLLAMLLVMAAIWLGLDALTGGTFLSPRNLFNLSLQGRRRWHHVVRDGPCDRVAPHRPFRRVPDRIHRRFRRSLAEFHPADRRVVDMVDRCSRDAGRRFAYRARSGSPHCLRRRSLIRHHARRLALLSQRRLLHQQRRHHRSSEQDVSAPWRWPGRDDRRVLELGRLRLDDRSRRRLRLAGAPDGEPRTGWPAVRWRCMYCLSRSGASASLFSPPP
jgi:hypothetical protein